jgi:hypothetical protein
MMVLFRVLAWAAIPLWAASAPVALGGTSRELMWVLACAGMGTCCALILLVMDRIERLWRQRAAGHERLTGELCGVIREELRPDGVARTRPDLRAVPGVPGLRVVRLAGPRGAAHARR